MSTAHPMLGPSPDPPASGLRCARRYPHPALASLLSTCSPSRRGQARSALDLSLLSHAPPSTTSPGQVGRRLVAAAAGSRHPAKDSFSRGRHLPVPPPAVSRPPACPLTTALAIKDDGRGTAMLAPGTCLGGWGRTDDGRPHGLWRGVDGEGGGGASPPAGLAGSLAGLSVMWPCLRT